MRTVVYVDDDETICKLMSRMIGRAGAEVITFTNPVEAIERINKSPPALVICDYRMPTMNGLAVLEQLEVNVPFVLISGDSSVDELREKGVTEVLAKPIRAEQFVEFVKRYI